VKRRRGEGGISGTEMVDRNDVNIDGSADCSFLVFAFGSVDHLRDLRFLACGRSYGFDSVVHSFISNMCFIV
jgi:hypothetical protein